MAKRIYKKEFDQQLKRWINQILMRILLAVVVLMLPLMLLGCSTAPEFKTVQVPVAVCVKSDAPARPALPVSSLPDSASDSEVVEAYAQSLSLCISYAKAQDELLKSVSCQKQ